jgi:hypothetical protein
MCPDFVELQSLQRSAVSANPSLLYFYQSSSISSNEPPGSRPHPYSRSHLSCSQRLRDLPRKVSKRSNLSGSVNMGIRDMYKPPLLEGHAIRLYNPRSEDDQSHQLPRSGHQSSQSNSSSTTAGSFGLQHPLSHESISQIRGNFQEIGRALYKC